MKLKCELHIHLTKSVTKVTSIKSEIFPQLYLKLLQYIQVFVNLTLQYSSASDPMRIYICLFSSGVVTLLQSDNVII